ncbi:MAG: Peroxiredoxin [Myxococcales bacterium]|nr:Peroxiredoxin [Myxococcales bacterium]
MKRLVLVAGLVAALVSCSKKETPKDPQPDMAAKTKEAPKDPHPQMGDTAAMFDPANLPAAGTAPPAVTVTKELDPMWSAPLKDLKGQPTTLASYKGKALMLVNVASKCGNTPQYATLEALQKKYEPKGFTVIGFPCNQFGGQEPGSPEEIATFCATNYGITFPIMEKIEVNGTNRHEVYKALTPIKDASGHDGDIRWNFEKFVVSADGTQITRFSPKTKPDDPTVIAAVEAALPKK